MALADLCSQIAWVIARIWPSLNVRSADVPRCPLVPKLTACFLFFGLGFSSKYCLSSFSTSRSEPGSGLNPARLLIFALAIVTFPKYPNPSEKIEFPHGNRPLHHFRGH